MTTSQHVRRMDPRVESEAAEPAASPAQRGACDALVLERVTQLLPLHDGALPMNVRLLRVVWEEPDYPGDRAVHASLSRLLASGALKPCLIRGEPGVMAGANLPGKARPLAPRVPQLDAPRITIQAPRPVVRLSEPEAASKSQAEADENERFELQVALDVEQERALLYRVLVVLEVLGCLLIAREFMIRWLSL